MNDEAGHGIAFILAMLGVRVRSKGTSRLMRVIGKVLGKWFMQRAWTTIGSRLMNKEE